MDVLNGKELFDVVVERGCFEEKDAAKTVCSSPRSTLSTLI